MRTKEELIQSINARIEKANKEIGHERFSCLGHGWHKTKPYAILDKSGIVEKRLAIMSMVHVLDMLDCT